MAAALDGLAFAATVTLPNAGANRIVVHAVDASGNRGMAIVGVTVLDAAPPELELAATPAVLWPPNHKMVTVTIDVRVSDDTDPSPEVRLRAERAGDGPGRVYTLTYRATDHVGNSVEESVEVTVPHGNP